MNPSTARLLPRPATRLQSIDIVRGAIMVLMLLDHVREFWNEGNGIDVVNLTQTTPELFFTRWITHFCAPLFIFLTGVSAYLTKHNKQQSSALAFRGLITRGLWLIGLEIVVISTLWGMIFVVNGILLQVIWAIGISLVCLSVLQFLPKFWIGLIGAALIIFHNLLPNLQGLPPLAQFLWNLVHQRAEFNVTPNYLVYQLYPIVPWIGVMALGYALGGIFTGESAPRRRALVIIGLSSIVALVVLRAFNIYGDPSTFQVQKDGLWTLMDFVNLQKYPPSFLYLLMTLGPGCLVLAALDKANVKDGHFLLIFGRTPLFFYVVHLASVVLITLLWGLITRPGALGAYGYDLIWTYLIWIALIPLLYLACRWYYRVKFSKPRWWTYYL